MNVHHLIMLAVLFLLHTMAVEANRTDPFAFFRASVVVSADDRRKLDAGEPLARALPTEDNEVAIFAAVPVTADGDRLVAWVRNIAEMKRSAYVRGIQRFSEPPRLDDLARLTLDDEDLSDIRECRPGACDLKLSAGEMRQLQSAIATAGSEWKASAQVTFRRLILERVQAYLHDGLAALSPYDDADRRVSLAASFSLLLQHSPFLSEHVPHFVEYLDRYPRVPATGVESFLYWSKERLASKSIISVTHVAILRGQGAALLPDALVAGKEIFATHYMHASLGLTALVGGEDARRYLVYLNRSEVDVVGGFFGGIVRWFLERRLKAEAPEVLQGLRRRLEGGEPMKGASS